VQDLQSPPLQLKKLGDIKKLGKCLKRIQEKHCALEVTSAGMFVDSNVAQCSFNFFSTCC